MNLEYAEKLRIGEERRDASPKIRGFLYQDLVALKIMLDLDDSYTCYIEWIEDVFFENEDNIIPIQVKYYPKSSVNFSEIYMDMYYQFLKYQLIGSGKNFLTFCYHHSNTIFDKDECKEYLTSSCLENSLTDDKKISILNELRECTNQEDRKKLLFQKASSKVLIENLRFESSKEASINDIKDEVSQKLFDLKSSNEIVKSLYEDEAKKMLIALSIDFIQDKYFSNNENYQERKILKKDLLEYLDYLLRYDEEEGIALIKGIFFNCIDDLIAKILDTDIEVDEAKSYKGFYRATKKYFASKLSSKTFRFKLINTINLKKRYKDFNHEVYDQFNIRREKECFLTNTDNIEAYIKFLWKLLFNIESNIDDINIEKYIFETEDCLLFNCSSDTKSPVFLSSATHNSSEGEEVNNIFLRVKEMENRPSKWYIGTSAEYRGCIGYYSLSYSLSINRIKNDKQTHYEVDDLDDDEFIIDCMQCLKCDIFKNEMGLKDNLKHSLFKSECINEV